VKVYFPWHLKLSAGAMVGPGVNIYNLAPVTIETGSNISGHAHLCTGTHDYLSWTMPLVVRPIVIGANTWLGTEVFVGPGVTIGELAVIGARSVVVKDQPARMVCAGHPCRPIKPRPDPQ
jgi:putative colanic acid biosynthesis acetyltransferase WcaF